MKMTKQPKCFTCGRTLPFNTKLCDVCGRAYCNRHKLWVVTGFGVVVCNDCHFKRKAEETEVDCIATVGRPAPAPAGEVKRETF